MVMHIYATSPSPNFHSGKSYVKKNNNVYFLAICVNFPCKIEKFELEVVGMGNLVRILLLGQALTYLIGKLQLKE